MILMAMMRDLVIHADAHWEVDHIVVGISECLQTRDLEKEEGDQFEAIFFVLFGMKFSDKSILQHIEH